MRHARAARAAPSRQREGELIRPVGVEVELIVAVDAAVVVEISVKVAAEVRGESAVDDIEVGRGDGAVLRS